MEEKNRNLFRRRVQSQNSTRRGKFITNLGPSSILGMPMYDELLGWNPMEAVLEAYQKGKDEKIRRLTGLTGIDIKIDWGKIKEESERCQFVHNDVFLCKLPKFP